MNKSILTHPSFIASKGKMLGEIIGGSNLYGLVTSESDIDYRGIFIATDKKYVTDFDKVESIVQTGDIDSAYYELVRYLKLLRKSNTQVLEILFAPLSSFTMTTPLFETIRENRYNLIDSNMLKASLKGYVYSEIRLATGQRSGQLGGKRKAAVEKYGFSYKNFVQILRLCKVGILFFEQGEYMVNVKDFDPTTHELLMSIKTHPEDYTCEQLVAMVDEEFKKLELAMDNSKILFKFDTELAADLVLSSRSIVE